MAEDGARKPLYPRSYQVSVTEETGKMIDALAARIASERRLIKPSASLVIREALEREYGGAHSERE